MYLKHLAAVPKVVKIHRVVVIGFLRAAFLANLMEGVGLGLMALPPYRLARD